jgi:hypothetical protein
LCFLFTILSQPFFEENTLVRHLPFRWNAHSIPCRARSHLVQFHRLLPALVPCFFFQIQKIRNKGIGCRVSTRSSNMQTIYKKYLNPSNACHLQKVGLSSQDPWMVCFC